MIRHICSKGRICKSLFSITQCFDMTFFPVLLSRALVLRSVRFSIFSFKLLGVTSTDDFVRHFSPLDQLANTHSNVNGSIPGVDKAGVVLEEGDPLLRVGCDLVILVLQHIHSIERRWYSLPFQAMNIPQNMNLNRLLYSLFQEWFLKSWRNNALKNEVSNLENCREGPTRSKSFWNNLYLLTDMTGLSGLRNAFQMGRSSVIRKQDLGYPHHGNKSAGYIRDQPILSQGFTLHSVFLLHTCFPIFIQIVKPLQ